MKYDRLTREQFEELHKEFINFLAAQSITAAEWEEIKTTKPETAEEELDVFSDLVWEGVLNQAQFLEHFLSHRNHNPGRHPCRKLPRHKSCETGSN